jgi:hypothetical protein
MGTGVNTAPGELTLIAELTLIKLMSDTPWVQHRLGALAAEVVAT